MISELLTGKKSNNVGGLSLWSEIWTELGGTGESNQSASPLVNHGTTVGLNNL